MKTFLRSLFILCLFIPASIIAQTDLSGVWEGKLVVAPGQEIDVQYTLESSADGSYTAVLDAPEQPSITAVPVDSVTIEGSTLTMEVSIVSGRYVGEIGSGTINGIWSQNNTEFELNLTPYEEPVITAENFARIDGSWVGALRPTGSPDFELAIVLEFFVNDDGEFVGTLSSPDQGGNDIPIDTLALEEDELVVEISQARIEIVTEISGDELVGTFNQAGQSFPITLARGEYEQAGLQLSALQFARVQGPWHGQVANLTVVLRVEQSDGNYLAYLDSPDQGATDIPIQEFTIDGDDVNFTIASINGSFSGTIAANALSGQWTQGGQTQPLELEKGPYVAHGNLSAEARSQLNGTWQGTVNNTELIFEFVNDGDSFIAQLDIPSLGANDVPVGNIELTADGFSFTVAAIGASFSGTLSDSRASGDWIRAGSTNPLSLNRQ